MDIKCVVCGEPWDVFLDMEEWEKKLFRAGAGCPCCEGVEPAEPWHPESFSDISNGDGDPIDRLHAYQDRANRPKWEPPLDEILWTCAGCGVNVVKRGTTGELEYDLPLKAKGAQWYHSHPYSRGIEDLSEPVHVFKPDQPVCEFCYNTCDHCGRPVCSLLDYGDCYEDGWCAMGVEGNYRNVYCIGCIEQQCAECGGFYDDGSCDGHCGEDATDEDEDYEGEEDDEE
jgi:hypothetical protein